MGNKGRGEKTKMNKGRREGQGERANNNKEFSYVFVWCLFRSLIGPKSGQNPKKKKHPNLQPHKIRFRVLGMGCGGLPKKKLVCIVYCGAQSNLSTHSRSCGFFKLSQLKLAPQTKNRATIFKSVPIFSGNFVANSSEFRKKKI